MICLLIFRKGGREREEREGERARGMREKPQLVASIGTQTRDRTRNLGMRWE